MSFLSLEFLIFVIVVFTVFYVAPIGVRKSVLLAASVVFIWIASPLFLIYSTLFILSNYYIGKFISNKDAKYRTQIYYLGQTINIGVLVFYKYINFILENVNLVLSVFSSVEIPYLSILIPVGISYYTFQGISYLYLVFKANDKPETNIVSMSLYMLFFPKILAGPIERHRLFLPQLKKPLVFDYEGVVEGGRLVLWGLFKKVVIGDTFAIMLNKVHGNLDAINGQVLLVAFLAHPIQLYFDFSGYTDIAIGLARIFGIKLSPNFNRPFLARTIGDFWRRWHISLSSWCNDFIYNRLLIKHRKWGEKAAFYSIFVCFMIIGIWHGAKWTYVVVGAFQVLALSYEFLTRKWRSTLTNKYPKALVVTASRLIVYIYVSLFLTFFFAIDVNSGFTFLYKMVSSGNLADFTLGGIYYVPEEFIIALVFAILILINEYFQEVRSYDILKLDKIPVYWRWSIYLSALFLISYFSKNESVFVYKGF